MKTLYSLFAVLSTILAFGQGQLDTLAIQDFEASPATPTWTYTGTLAGTQTGSAPAGSCIPGTPLGINASTAWHVETVSAGNPIVFDNTTIPAIYDSVFVSFRLAGLNLLGTTGGPDNLDYVLVEYSTDGGMTYVPRVRVRGAINNNSFWPYDATGNAIVDYLPATESVFQPINTGLQMTEGISYVKIGFPGSIGQVTVRITPRSSSSSDSWLVDNVLLTGKTSCTPSTNTISPIACESYTSPAGNIYTTSGAYTDIIPNSAGCDSIISINLTVNPLPDNSVTQSGATLTANASSGTFQWLDCDNNLSVIPGATSSSYAPLAVSGNYAVEVTLNGCSDTSTCYLVDFTGIDELTATGQAKKIVKIIDLLGRETEFTPNTPLIYIYSDGTIERLMKLEE